MSINISQYLQYVNIKKFQVQNVTTVNYILKMKDELQNYLKKKFPLLYPQNFSFDCDDGWFRLLLWLSRYLDMYITQQNEMAKTNPQYYQSVKQIVARQIKQKFGTLRFYCDGGDEHTKSIIEYTTFISGYICEQTGNTNDVGYNNKGYIQVLHKDLARNKNDFNFVDDEELRTILKTYDQKTNAQ
jgi:hypothetical protein